MRMLDCFMCQGTFVTVQVGLTLFRRHHHVTEVCLDLSFTLSKLSNLALNCICHLEVFPLGCLKITYRIFLVGFYLLE